MRHNSRDELRPARDLDSEGSDVSEALVDPRTGNYRNVVDPWHEGMEVRRGSAPMRLDLKHGFVLSIVRLMPGPG